VRLFSCSVLVEHMSVASESQGEVHTTPDGVGWYGVATISRLLKITGLISSLL